MSVILIVVIIIIAFIKISKQNIENFCDKKIINHKKKIIKPEKNIDNSLKIVNEYNRQDLPRYLKVDVIRYLNNNILSKFKNRLNNSLDYL